MRSWPRLALLALPVLLLGARGGFDHRFELAPIALPKAHHGEKMQVSSFLLPGPEIRSTPAKVLKQCAQGKDVRGRMPLGYGVIELRMGSLSLGGVELERLQHGRVPINDSGRVRSLRKALDVAHQESTWLRRAGCVPWEKGQPWLLLAVDHRVPSASVRAVMETALAAGFPDFAVLVDDGSPSPELPLEELPESPVQVVLLQEREGFALVLEGAPSVFESLDEIAIGIRSHSWGPLPDRALVVMRDEASFGDFVQVHDTLVGAGVLNVVPVRVASGVQAWPPEPMGPAQVEEGWTWQVDSEGVLPVHLVRLPESGLSIPRPRVGPFIEPGAGVVIGSVRKIVVENRFTEAFVPVKRCYAEALRGDPGLAGELEVEFIIEEDGRIDRVRLLRSDLESPPVEACLLSALKGMRFEPQERSTIVSYPFTLSP